MKKNAFTLLEVILAIFILTVAVSASFALIQQTLISASLNQSKLTAFYLAQEGVEIVRNIRDNNWLDGVSWKTGLATGEYEADYSSLALSENFNTYLRLDSAGGFYSYSGDTETKFKRKISITEKDGDILEVSVSISWSERSIPHSVEVVEKLHNWYGN